MGYQERAERNHCDTAHTASTSHARELPEGSDRVIGYYNQLRYSLHSKHQFHRSQHTAGEHQATRTVTTTHQPQLGEGAA